MKDAPDNWADAALHPMPHAPPPSPASSSLGQIKLPLFLKQMGEAANCRHRSGWPFVMEAMRERHSPDGVLLDDFVERSFQHRETRQEWREPWFGVFHHPPDLPSWLDSTAPPDVIINLPEFRNSLPFLRGAIALSAHLGEWLERNLGCPVTVLKHPTAAPPVYFSMDAFRAERKRRLVQVGWYGRNLRAIYQVAAPTGFRKIHLLQNRPWVQTAIERTDLYSPLGRRHFTDEVEVIEEISNEEYDELLASSVVFNHYWAVSASNTIVESIARCTPIVVNRHPALIEYLGEDYPLFYDELDDVAGLVEDEGRIAASSQYLGDLDRAWMSPVQFSDEVIRFVHRSL